MLHRPPRLELGSVTRTRVEGNEQVESLHFLEGDGAIQKDPIRWLSQYLSCASNRRNIVSYDRRPTSHLLFFFIFLLVRQAPDSRFEDTQPRMGVSENATQGK